MHIQKLSVQNIKCFQDITLDFRRGEGESLAGWTVIVGPNGSGKTTLLRAMVLPLVNYRDSVRLLDTFHGWLSDGEVRGFSRVSVVSDGATDVECRWAGSRGQVSLSIIEDGYDFDASILCAYGPFRHLTHTGGTLPPNVRDSQNYHRLLSLFREDFPLQDAVAWLQDVHLRALEGRPGNQMLKDIAISILNDGLLPGDLRVERVDADGLWIRSGGGCRLLKDLSDGYRTTTALVLDIIRETLSGMVDSDLPAGHVNGRPVIWAEGVVLIDEADAHLHPSWQKRIGFWLKEHFPNVQFIVTTHSPFICQAADPGGLFVLPTPGSGEGVRKIEGQEFWQIVNGGADDVSLSRLFGLDRTHSQQSEDLREELARLEVRLMKGQASEAEQRRYLELRSRLPNPEESLLRALDSLS